MQKNKRITNIFARLALSVAIASLYHSYKKNIIQYKSLFLYPVIV
ncbi:hypothetical protein GCWU000282_03039 [Catonella morbi ATCC 51271]|uniref:Uncharacterized protein n=1 Tax=Catonella morbi ATCC 51271 TaxID=592026 RepID=V2Y104_9FIRM|nr:hypothetical protein GCWU000282_03039 [Catonella morbi ATCC 51271]